MTKYVLILTPQPQRPHPPPRRVAHLRDSEGALPIGDTQPGDPERPADGRASVHKDLVQREGRRTVKRKGVCGMPECMAIQS